MADDQPRRAGARRAGHHHGGHPLDRPGGRETAPILFTAVVFSQRYLPSSVFDPVMALPYHLFILATNVPGAETNKDGTAVVLILLVCAFYAVAIVIRNRYHTTLRL